LEGVVEVSANQFNEVNDVIMRYDTLMSTLADLQGRAHNAQERQEMLRRELNGKTETLHNTMLSLTNQMATVQNTLEDVQRRAQDAQQRFDAIISNASQKDLMLGQTRMYAL
jgi:predicted  nucleic acid-binding Zn-ribbon protein